MNLYVSLFKDSEVKNVERYGGGESGAAGSVKRAEFTLSGHRLACIDSSVKHSFGFTPVDLPVRRVPGRGRAGQGFGTLSEGGAVLMPPGNYGFSTKFTWLNDRFGVSWQLNLR